ncbi:MAG: hypothetical protein SNJ84_08765, partial [Verrucomicrobiia bacterium]
RRLHRFHQACDLLYRQSCRGRAPSWIAEWLDAGKPADLIAFARARPLVNQLPRIIRPDLLLTDHGWALAEIDSVPGGIGLTAWLQENYARLGHPVLGGPTGMRHAFHQLLPKGPVVISEEASAYQPEWEWLLGPQRIIALDSFRDWSTPAYRFFESFEWEACPTLRTGLDPAHPLTPPLKPFLEEKLWLALFWLPALRHFWRCQLGDRYDRDLRQIIPQSWIVEPTPLPPTAVLPGLNAHSWEQVGQFSRSERNLVLKVSGYSPQAWGSRGVLVGTDVGNEQWAAAIAQALAEFPRQPRILQRFHKATSFTHPYWDPHRQTLIPMHGRARVCPYYFVQPDDTVLLAGVLVTFCPEDKKLLHGMEDAILAPAQPQTTPQPSPGLPLAP